MGPEARTTFELVEVYRPLSLAYNQLNRKNFNKLFYFILFVGPRALHSPLNKPPYVNSGGLRSPPKGSPVEVLVDFTEIQIDNNPQQQPEQQGRVADLLNDIKTTKTPLNSSKDCY